MKKNKIKGIFKFLSFVFVNIIICGLVIGLLTGTIVTFLFSTPKISLTDTFVKFEEEKVYFNFYYENKGQTPAINVEYVIRYVILNDKNDVIFPYKPGEGRKFSEYQEQFEVGDKLNYGFWIDITNSGIEKDVFQNSEFIILAKTKYKDCFKLRYFINKLLGEQYSAYRLSSYDVSTKERVLSLLSPEKRNEFERMINIWLES